MTKILTRSGLGFANICGGFQPDSEYDVWDPMAAAMISDGLATKVDTSDDGNGDSRENHDSPGPLA